MDEYQNQNNNVSPAGNGPSQPVYPQPAGQPGAQGGYQQAYQGQPTGARVRGGSITLASRPYEDWRRNKQMGRGGYAF